MLSLIPRKGDTMKYINKIQPFIGSILVFIALSILLIIRIEKGYNLFNDGLVILLYGLYPILLLTFLYQGDRHPYRYTLYLIALFAYGVILYATSGYFRIKYLDVSSVTIVIYAIILLFYQGGLVEHKHHRNITILSKKGLFYTITPVLLLVAVYLFNEFIIEFIK